MLDQSIQVLTDHLPLLARVAIGGTVLGTGINSPEGFDIRMAEKLAEFTGHPFVPATNKFAALAAHDSLVSCHGALKTVAVSLSGSTSRNPIGAATALLSHLRLNAV